MWTLTVHSKDTKKAKEPSGNEQSSHFLHSEWEVFSFAPPHIPTRADNCYTHACEQYLKGVVSLAIIPFYLQFTGRNIHEGAEQL